MKSNLSSKNPEAAFNLTELCVVIACVAVLAMLVLPALAAGKVQSASAGCLYNLRHLMTGWAMYRTEYNDYLMPNSPLGASSNSWCGGEAEGWSNNDANTNPVVYTSSLMWPYVGNNLSVYRCPGDVVPSANGQRIRSYSMQGQMGTTLQYQSYAKVYLKGGDISGNPRTSDLIVFLDENPCSLNDGYLQVNNAFGAAAGTYVGSATFPDVPACYLEGGCGISFADGHSEIHKWVTGVLKIPVIYGFYANNIVAGPTPPANANADWLWFTQHASSHQ